MTNDAREQGSGVGGMSRRTAAWLAWALRAVCVALISLAHLLDFLTDDVSARLPGKDQALASLY